MNGLEELKIEDLDEVTGAGNQQCDFSEGADRDIWCDIGALAGQAYRWVTT